LFKFFAQHLKLFFALALACGAAFTLVVSPFRARRFPAFESLSHMFIANVSFMLQGELQNVLQKKADLKVCLFTLGLYASQTRYGFCDRNP
jgi:hypothetical protein